MGSRKAISIAEIATGALLMGVGIFDLVTDCKYTSEADDHKCCKKTCNPSIPLEGFNDEE